MGIGFELVAIILLMMYLGGLADEKLGTDNVFRLLGIVAGFIIWFFHLMQILKKTSGTEEDTGRDNSDANSQQ